MFALFDDFSKWIVLQNYLFASKNCEKMMKNLVVQLVCNPFFGSDFGYLPDYITQSIKTLNIVKIYAES